TVRDCLDGGLQSVLDKLDEARAVAESRRLELEQAHQHFAAEGEKARQAQESEAASLTAAKEQAIASQSVASAELDRIVAERDHVIAETAQDRQRLRSENAELVAKVQAMGQAVADLKEQMGSEMNLVKETCAAELLSCEQGYERDRETLQAQWAKDKEERMQSFEQQRSALESEVVLWSQRAAGFEAEVLRLAETCRAQTDQAVQAQQGEFATAFAKQIEEA
ncbi:unnamed protein product, partial [Amoebophrya sp. A25]